jgi:hypothetical protein
VPESQRNCERIDSLCHSERSEESAVVCFHEDKCRCFALLSMTALFLHRFRRFPHPAYAGRQSRCLRDFDATLPWPLTVRPSRAIKAMGSKLKRLASSRQV